MEMDSSRGVDTPRVSGRQNRSAGRGVLSSQSWSTFEIFMKIHWIRNEIHWFWPQNVHVLDLKSMEIDQNQWKSIKISQNNENEWFCLTET